MLISEFDQWKSKLCTCPPKLTFNPYTGCDHGCVYCYASSYIPKFYDCKPKKELLRRLGREARKLRGELISISNSSDPYPNIDILKKTKCMVVLSITTDDDVISRRLEPHASVSSKRLEAIENLVKNDIPAAVRIDPIIPS